MASISEQFEIDPSTAHSILSAIKIEFKEKHYIAKFRLFIDTNAACRYFSLYLTEDIPFEAIKALVEDNGSLLPNFISGCDLSIRPGTTYIKVPAEGLGGEEIKFGIIGGRSLSLKSMKPSGRVFLYTSYESSVAQRTALESLATEKIDIVIRGPRYAEQSEINMLPQAFISHDSRDKSEIARPLAEKLHNLGTRVWFDEYSLQVGDSLRESIEKGLKECKYCILILTPNFLSKGGWAKREYDSIFTRELVEDKKVILPIWDGVTRDDIYAYSPVLIDRLALNWSEGVDVVGAKLYSKINS